MEYEKGNFVVVPNKKALKKLSATAQALFLQLCGYVDKKGTCFPSRKRLARDMGVGVRTVDKYIKNLCKEGFIEKKKRMSEKGQSTNLYRIVLISAHTGAEKDTEGATKSTRGGVQKKTHRTISNKTIPNQLSSSSGDEASGALVNRVIASFKEVNPSYARFFSNKTQRKAVAELIRLHGLERVLGAIGILRRTNTEPYLPTVVSPLHLLDKWASLEAGVVKINRSHQKNKRIVL